MTREFNLHDRVRDDGGLEGIVAEIGIDGGKDEGYRAYAVIEADGRRHRRYLGEIKLVTDAVSHELQGSGYDPGACGYELQGRKTAP